MALPQGKTFIATDEVSQLREYGIVVPYILRPKGEVYLKIEGGDRKITPPPVGASSPSCLDAVLSPDRKKVLIHCIGTKSHLSVHDVLSNRDYQLGVIAEPGSWSPDGSHLLYLLEISDGHVVFWNDLYVTHYSGGKKVKIARVKGTAHGASWGKDNVIGYEQEGKIIVAKMNLT